MTSVIYNEQVVRAILGQKIRYACLRFGSRFVAWDMILLDIKMIEVFENSPKTLNFPSHPEVIILPTQKESSNLSISTSMSRWPESIDGVLKIRGKGFRIWNVLINEGYVVGVR